MAQLTLLLHVHIQLVCLKIKNNKIINKKQRENNICDCNRCLNPTPITLTLSFHQRSLQTAKLKGDTETGMPLNRILQSVFMESRASCCMLGFHGADSC